MSGCPECGEVARQIKAGRNETGSARFYCQGCKRTYTPEQRRNGHDPALRSEAIRLRDEGLAFRRIGRILNIAPQTVINWVRCR